jgi:hypothetical protein|tara:strand:- start:830 stop:1342 length:513 start_codon:yes stop_codon:yes gene_type:complete
MNLQIISDKNKAKDIFVTAMMYDDNNRLNYTEDEFNTAWKKWLNFYVLYDDKNVIGFCGIRKFEGGYGRIFDRYFIMPEYRYDSLRHKEYSLDIVSRLMHDCKEANLIPFFSIEKGRRIIELAVKKFNNKLLKEDQLKVLPGLYGTTPTSWQNIATPYPYGTHLKRKEDG